jgi:hypothetical protein
VPYSFECVVDVNHTVPFVLCKKGEEEEKANATTRSLVVKRRYQKSVKKGYVVKTKVARLRKEGEKGKK